MVILPENLTRRIFEAAVGCRQLLGSLQLIRQQMLESCDANYYFT